MNPPANIRAALIDMDGTLYDSMPNHARAWMQMCATAGLQATPEEFYVNEGATGAAMIDTLVRRTHGRAATDAERRDLYAVKARNFAAQPPVAVMPGAQQLVSWLLSRGIVTVLVTGSGQGSLLDRLDTDFPGAFPAARRITSASVTHGKPHPEPFERAAALAGADPARCIAIDNAPLGVRSAHDAGIYTIGVVTGPVDPGSLYSAGADIVFNSMPDCTKLLPSLLS